jgi:DNA modification methylase
MTKEINGLLMKSWTSHPEFYPQKVAKEKELGRQLSTADFLENYFVVPTDGAYASGTSIFDPVLCELAYRWFCPIDGTILDPFAGGSVRGIVASKLDRKYIGHELRSEQVEANRIQAERICSKSKHQPVWIIGDSKLIDQTCKDVEADFVFSCPPYVDLEVYSDDPKDLSTLEYPEFLKAYREIIAKSCFLLKQDRFACFVVGDVRDKKGNYYNFVGDTVRAFIDAGLSYYNEAILVTAVGSLPIRVGKQFESSRKLGKTHQNVLVFVKGDGKKATQAIGKCEFGKIDQAEQFGEVLK